MISAISEFMAAVYHQGRRDCNTVNLFLFLFLSGFILNCSEFLQTSEAPSRKKKVFQYQLLL